MRRRFTILAMSGVLAVGLAAGATTAAAPAVADTQLCEQWATAPIEGGRYIVQNNRWGTSATQCLNVTSTGFSVIQADGSVPTNGAPKSYPSVYYGCHYGTCSTSGNILSPNGVQASDPVFRTITTSVRMTFPSSGTWNAAYDIWFHRTQPTSTTGQNDGAELMIWLDHRGPIQPIGSLVGTATIASATWDVWFGNTGWNVISYVRQSGTNALDLRVADFWDDVVSRDYGSTSWYLTSIQVGFEPWDSGVGLTVNDFDVSTSAAPGPGPGPGPEPGPGPGSECAASYATVDSWSGGFQGEVTVHNPGSAALDGWDVSWSFAGSQTVSNAWNATVTQSGSAVTAVDTGYNAAIAPGGSTTFGFVATGSAPSSLSLTCTGGDA